MSLSRSDHFNGHRFFNPWHREEPSRRFFDMLRWMLHRNLGPWREWTDGQSMPDPPQLVNGGELRVTFINHSTTLLQMDGLNILTDPIWAEHAGPWGRFGPRRHRLPGLRIDQLPRIHVILISHDHYDHLCIPTLKELQQRHHPLILAGLRVGHLIGKAGISGWTELDWWQQVKIGTDTRIISVPAQHFSARGIFDRNKTLWMGFVIEGPSGRIYCAGDTGYAPHLAMIAERFAPIRLALLPIGAYKPQWFMKPVHMSPAEAVQAQQTLRAGTAVGIHFGTFALADDSELDPVSDFRHALEAVPSPPRFWVLDFGEGRNVS